MDCDYNEILDEVIMLLESPVIKRIIELMNDPLFKTLASLMEDPDYEMLDGKLKYLYKERLEKEQCEKKDTFQLEELIPSYCLKKINDAGIWTAEDVVTKIGLNGLVSMLPYGRGDSYYGSYHPRICKIIEAFEQNGYSLLPEPNPLLSEDSKVDELPIHGRILAVLHENDIYTISDLLKHSRRDLKKINGLAEKSVENIFVSAYLNGYRIPR